MLFTQAAELFCITHAQLKCQLWGTIFAIYTHWAHCLCNEVITRDDRNHRCERVRAEKQWGAHIIFSHLANLPLHGRLVLCLCERASEQGHSNKTQRTRDSIHNYRRVIQRCDHDIVVCVRQIAESVTNNATASLASQRRDFTFVLVKSRLWDFFSALGLLKIRTHVAYVCIDWRQVCYDSEIMPCLLSALFS